MSDSLITKRAIAAGLKELTRSKSFDKISIADITQSCGLNRQTFYYHFQDKYELLGWIYYNEAFAPVVDGISFENWDRRILLLLQTMQRDREFYRGTLACAVDIFNDYLFGITRTLFFEAADKLDARGTVAKEDKDFFAGFFAYGICGVVVSWAKGGMKTPPETVANNLKSLAQSSEKLAFERYMEENQ